MAKTPERPPPKAEGESTPPDTRTPLERMTDLTRRIVHVPKSELPTGKKKRKRHS
jgi:hypothetical protein